MISVTIGGITFSNDPTNPYGLQTIEGWYSSPAVKTQTEERPNSDGAFGVVNFYRGARTVTIAGLLVGQDNTDALVNMWPGISAIMSSGMPSTMTVTDDLGALSSTVMPTGTASLVPITNGLANYVLSFIAFDPVKYSAPVTSSTTPPTAGGGLEYNLFAGGSGGALYYGALGNLGRVTVTNSGTAAVWPLFNVTGNFSAGFYIQCLETGDIIRYDRSIPDGSTITLDSRVGTATVDGTSDASSYLTLSNWFNIPPFTTRTVQVNPIGTSSGAAAMSVTNSNGYW